MRTFLLPLLLAALAAADVSDAEAKLQQDAATAVAAFAADCARSGAKADGLAAVAEARALDRLCAGIKPAEDALVALPADAPAEDWAKKRAEAGKGVAKVYDRLASLKHDDKEGARFDDYALRALRWDPSDGRVKKAAAAADAAGNRIVEAGLLVRGILRADPAGSAKGKYDGLVERLASKDLFVLGSVEQDLVAFVSLPKGWKKGGKYPILVAVDGAGCGFEGCGRGFATARGSRPLIVVSPMTFTNTNTLDASKYPAYTKELLAKWDGNRIDFDGPGVDAVLAEVRKRFGGEEKVFVTGFSGGGNWCYWKLLHDPEHVRGAAPACANFAGYGVNGAPGAGATGGPPVHIFTGEKDEHRDFTFGKKDSPGIEPQTDNAVAALKQLGYTHVERTMIPGVGHNSCGAQVLKFIDDVLGAK